MVEGMYTSTEQAAAPICGVCGRKLAVGFHFTCHVCGESFCYAHSPEKCSHPRLKQAARRAQIAR
ncbi:MAG: hypothetical protein JRN08_02885 [Nitrososphaerota archaeon]|nr:hypothetical protein [Nitrososphaerota archaeon]